MAIPEQLDFGLLHIHRAEHPSLQPCLIVPQQFFGKRHRLLANLHRFENAYEIPVGEADLLE